MCALPSPWQVSQTLLGTSPFFDWPKAWVVDEMAFIASWQSVQAGSAVDSAAAGAAAGGVCAGACVVVCSGAGAGGCVVVCCAWARPGDRTRQSMKAIRPDQ